ncbi:alpha/beta fold hydrolase [Micromonospora zhanjiangensis]|uniref:Alpha/beta hydrolase n=1 Tax=Micromonospora zhanjiangensis TaxID=1522057 RepID=A0ABV8KM85_9ACTN
MADAVVIPGGRYGPGTPLLMYGGDVAERRGATVHRHEWSPRAPFSDTPDAEEIVCADLTPLLDSLDGRPLLIGKSFGSNAARLAVERQLPAVWLTPLLTRSWVVAALRRASAPFLLVGGTGDGLWDGVLARELTPHVFEVPGADHGMYVPGPLTESVAVLGRVVVAVDRFLDDINWPDAPAAS